MEKTEGKKGSHLVFFYAFQAYSCSLFNYPIIQPLLVYKCLTTDDQINESMILFIFKLNFPYTIVYNEFTLFTSQFPSVQIPTAYAACLTDLIKYYISSSTFLPLTKRDNSSEQLIYLNRGTWYIWLHINQTWRKFVKKI